MKNCLPSGRGRLTADREIEVYDAVIAELGDHGYDRLSMDSVAKRAKCSKATLYRQWDGKLDLVSTALVAGKDHEDHSAFSIDTGTLRGDLHAWAEAVVPDLATNTHVILAVIRAVREEPELGRAVREHLAQGKQRGVESYVDRAVERGEIPPNPKAAEHLVAALGGPLLMHPLLTGRELTASDLIGYLDAVVLPALGITAHVANSDSPRS